MFSPMSPLAERVRVQNEAVEQNEAAGNDLTISLSAAVRHLLGVLERHTESRPRTTKLVTTPANPTR